MAMISADCMIDRPVPLCLGQQEASPSDFVVAPPVVTHGPAETVASAMAMTGVWHAFRESLVNGLSKTKDTVM